MSPALSATERREIAGSIYGQSQQYRTSQLIVSSQTLGTVWRALRGNISDEVKSQKTFDEIFQPGRRNIGIEAGSALVINKAISISKLATLLDWLEATLTKNLTPRQREDFAFLNGLIEVSSRKSKDVILELKESLGVELLQKVAKREPLEFDFSHKKFVNYQGAEKYYFTDGALEDISWQGHPPTCDEVIYALKDSGWFDAVSDGNGLIEVLEKTRFIAGSSVPFQSVEDNILNHLHGEVRHNNKSYFLIDGKWYVAADDFLNRVKDDFKKLLNSDHFASLPSVPIKPFLSNIHVTEGKYNESYGTKDDWLVADRVFIEHVEIADLVHWHDGKLYIIHNKIGFGVTMRDACSQVLHSMNIMDRIKSTSDTSLLSEYHQRIAKKHYQGGASLIAEEDFINTILSTPTKDITYILGYAKDKAITSSTRSNIAKFESIKLCNTDRKAFDFGLRILHIPTQGTAALKTPGATELA